MILRLNLLESCNHCYYKIYHISPLWPQGVPVWCPAPQITLTFQQEVKLEPGLGTFSAQQIGVSTEEQNNVR